MSDWIAQGLLTLAIVVVSSLLTFFTTQGTERAKWRREFDRRWDARRLEALSEYGDAVKTLLTRSWDVARSFGLGTSVSPISRDQGLHFVDEAESARGTKFEVVLLLASAPTIAAAREWHAFAWDFAAIANGDKETTPDDFMALRDSSFQARDKFYELARLELGIDIGTRQS